MGPRAFSEKARVEDCRVSRQGPPLALGSLYQQDGYLLWLRKSEPGREEGLYLSEVFCEDGPGCQRGKGDPTEGSGGRDVGVDLELVGDFLFYSRAGGPVIGPVKALLDGSLEGLVPTCSYPGDSCS